MDHAKSPSRKEVYRIPRHPSLGFQGRSPWLFLVAGIFERTIHGAIFAVEDNLP